MSIQTTETLQRLLQTFLREQLAALPPEERQKFEQQFEDRFNELLKNAANGGMEGFLDLFGFGGKGPIEFENLPYPHITPDFDDSVVPSQLHAAAELYYIYQHERMKVFQVIEVLRRLFQQGRMRIQRGPGARALYTIEKWAPLRYTLRDRMIAYRRAFNYGNIFALTVETGHHLKTVLQLLDTPDIKKSFDANTKWDVVEVVSNRYLGGIAEPSQRAKMAESGRRILQFIADNDFKTALDPILFQSEARPMGPHAEARLAAYRTTPEGRGFSGVTPALRSVLGI